MAQASAVSAGGVVFREIDGTLKFALAREPDKGANAWVLPKGHVDEGESLEQAALREIREEVGLENVQLIKYLGTIVRPSVEDWGETVQKTIHIYLGYALDDLAGAAPAGADQDAAQWFSAAEALEVIPFEEDRAFLREQLAPLLNA